MQNHVNPAMDFTQTPPGMLALDNMLYLAKVHQDTYIRVSVGLGCLLLLFPARWKRQSHLHIHLLSLDRLSWRTAAERTSMNARLAGVPLSSLECCARYSRLESCVSKWVFCCCCLSCMYNYIVVSSPLSHSLKTISQQHSEQPVFQNYLLWVRDEVIRF